MESWSFLTNHARVLLRIAEDPGARLRDIAATVGITERSAYGIVTDLTAAGYVVKHKDGRRNRYQIQTHLPLPEPTSQEPTSQEPTSHEPTSHEPTIGDVLAVLMGDRGRQKLTLVQPAALQRDHDNVAAVSALELRRGQARPANDG